MTYTISTDNYNEKRYGRPWAAIVTTSLTTNFEWLLWDGKPGYAGEFSFDVEPGTMIARGQKDHRKGRGGVDGYYVCMPDGMLAGVSSANAAGLRKLIPANRWRVCAQQLLDYNVSRLNVPYGYQDAQAGCARFSALLGVPDPARAGQAKALGLVTDEPKPATPVPAISMDAFGV